ncbi:type II secretion system F family protein [Nocardioides panacisoli]|uniref:type II secretion system F family protein n=1 Tax=Nocardioides panacisoli TaxID=627624 RepID=UPI001C62FF67|nr:type II secretion system F family protein [Nocardioides panacisoli]QYJ04242.1 type II secretion system F family protein [Nocardioides panacisoli]
MSLAIWGGVLGGLLGSGLLLVVARVLVLRRAPLEARVLPYVRDLAPVAPAPVAAPSAGVVGAVFGPLLRRAADGVERVLGGAPSVRRRLARAGIDRTVHDFRVEQVQWGLVGFSVTAAYGVLRTWTAATNPVPMVVLALVGFVLGVLWRDNRLTAQVKQRERAVLAEFPILAELLALAVAAGEGPVAALDRVVRRSGGALSADLSRVLAAVRTGQPVADAFDELAATTGVPVVARFAHGLAVALERGTPLADVLHAQAADVRESGRRELIEQGSRREIFMMVPVVFLVLPVTVIFAFWPGLVGLSLTTP